MHGYIYIILKESLKNVPIIGWGAQFYNFIFLSRKWEQDQNQFKAHLDQLNNPDDPMWLLIFPEGTNLAKGTKEKSAEWAKKTGVQDMKHQLLPRSRGIQFCLQNLRKTTDWLYDCTIGYEGIPYVLLSSCPLAPANSPPDQVNLVKTYLPLDLPCLRVVLQNQSTCTLEDSVSLIFQSTMTRLSTSGCVTDGGKRIIYSSISSDMTASLRMTSGSSDSKRRTPKK